MSLLAKQKLSEKQISILNSEMEKHKKSTGLSYVLLIFFGSLGIHKFYIGKALWGVIYLILGILGWTTIFTGAIAAIADDASSASGLGTFGLICLIVLGILLLIDLFTIPRQLNKKYERAEESIMQQLLDQY